MESKNQIKSYEDEMDLIDLIRTIYNGRRLVVGITLLVSLMSLGAALYVRANNHNNTAVNFILRNNIDGFYMGKANLRVRNFDHRDVLKEDSAVKELMGTEAMKNFLKDSDKTMNINEEREFLEKLLILNPIEEEVSKEKRFRYYQLEVEQKQGLDEKAIMEKYLEIVNRERYKRYLDAVDEEYEDVKRSTELYRKDLAKINAEINGLIAGESDMLLQNEGLVGVLTVKHPIEIREQRRLNELYEKYSNELTGLEGVRNDKRLKEQIEIVSSFYEVENKSKAMLILVVGVLMGAILGIVGVFIKEFTKHYKKRIVQYQTK